MSKEKKPAALELIQAMDRSEKGYFMKFAQMLGKGSNLVQFFQILSKMETFSKEKLIQELQAKDIPYSQLSVSLHNLHQTILKSLRMYHEKNYISIQVNNLISEAEILSDKVLKHQALKKIEKAEQLAREHFLHTQITTIIKMKASIMLSISKKNILPLINSQYTDIAENVANIQEEMYFKRLHHLMLTAIRYSGNKNLSANPTLQGIFEDEMLLSEEEPSSFYAQFYKYSALSLRATTVGTQQEKNFYFKKALQLWNEHPKIIKAYPVTYRKILSNYLGNAIIFNAADDFEEQIQHFENIPTRFLNEKMELFQGKFYLQQLYYLNNDKLEEAYELPTKYQKELKSYRSKMIPSSLISYKYNHLLVCFLLGKFDEGVDWVNKILAHRDIDVKPSLRTFCRVLELILHYELDNLLLLDSLLDSVWRKRKTNTVNPAYLERILKHFKKLIKPLSAKEIRELCIIFKQDLKDIQKEEKQLYGLDELLIWTESKIQNIEIRAAYREMLESGKS